MPLDAVNNTITAATSSISVPAVTTIHGGIEDASRVSKKSTTKKKKKDRCHFQKCSNTILKLIGDCQFCNGNFCSRHRIMENHSCGGLTSCKEQSHQKNADKLASEQIIVPKIQI